jgi:hypothetical protein
LLYVAYLPPYVYEDGTHDRQAIVTALFEEPIPGGGIQRFALLMSHPYRQCMLLF